MPALIIVIDEYAELADEAPGAVRHADSVARRGRAVAVNLIAATQRPTQKAMGQGAVRSQMDVRICFRVRERKDVDLILGQGMLAAGWNAHTLNAPGKFLLAAAEHDTPRRARAYLLTDESIAGTASRYAGLRPPLDASRSRAGPNVDGPWPRGPPARGHVGAALCLAHRRGRFPTSPPTQAWAAAGLRLTALAAAGTPPRSPGDDGVDMSSAGWSCTRLCTCTASRVSARTGAHGFRARARAQVTQRDGRAPAERP